MQKRKLLDMVSKLPIMVISTLSVLSINTLGTPAMQSIPGGSCSMGGGWQNNGPVHNVTISPFFMASTEIIQAEYQQVMGNNPSDIACDSCPVNQVTWFDAVLYCNALSKKELKDTCYTYTAKQVNGVHCGALTGIACDFKKTGYRLPSEAEWEYAYHGGKTGAFYWDSVWSSGVLDAVVILYAVARTYTPPQNYPAVQSTAHLRPNAWGLYDMAGNAIEWCWDWFSDPYSTAILIDPMGPSGPNWSNSRIGRGGSFQDPGEHCCAVYRYTNPPGFSGNNWGFRVVRSISSTHTNQNESHNVIGNSRIGIQRIAGELRVIFTKEAVDSYAHIALYGIDGKLYGKQLTAGNSSVDLKHRIRYAGK